MRRWSQSKGFTLMELLLVAAILVFALCGLLATYINMFFLSDLCRDFVLATNGLQRKMEEIKRTDFDNLLSLDGMRFEINGFLDSDAEGVIEVDNTLYSDLRKVRLVVSFKSRGRVIGEDRNLNGALNVGEDANGNSRLDSPAELVTLISRCR